MDIQKIAKLARLQLAKDEQEKIAQQLDTILNAFDKIKNINTQGVLPLITPVEIHHELRPDKHEQEVDTDKYIELAPEASGRLYKVPRVIS